MHVYVYPIRYVHALALQILQTPELSGKGKRRDKYRTFIKRKMEAEKVTDTDPMEVESTPAPLPEKMETEAKNLESQAQGE